jgi:hypothetical protein
MKTVRNHDWLRPDPLNVLARVAGEDVAIAMRELPAAESARDEVMSAKSKTVSGEPCLITFKRMRITGGRYKSIRCFWVGERAELIGNDPIDS